jgi:hypothetical protein
MHRSRLLEKGGERNQIHPPGSVLRRLDGGPVYSALFAWGMGHRRHPGKGRIPSAPGLAEKPVDI